MEERKVKDLGSIRKSVNVLDIDIFETVNVEHSKLAKGSRCLARISASVVIGSLVATIGAIWHTCYVAVYSCLYFTNNNDNEHYYKNICQASNSLLTDGTLAFFGAICPYLLYKQFFKNAQVMTALVVATAALPILIGLLPQQVPRLFIQKDLRLPFYKSILLKNTYGIVAENGKLLSWNAADDREHTKFIDGHFGEIYVQQGLNFLSTVEQIKQELPNGFSLRMTYPPTANNIRSQLTGVDFPNKAAYLAKLKDSERSLTRVRGFLELFLDMQENSVFHYYFEANSNIHIPKFPFNENYCQSFFGSNARYKPSSGYQPPPRQNPSSSHAPPPTQTAWESALQKARAEIQNNGLGPNERYIAYKTRIFTASTAAALFDLKPGYTAKDAKRAYLKAALVLHPDKVPNEYRKETEEIFKIYGTAQSILRA